MKLAKAKLASLDEASAASAASTSAEKKPSGSPSFGGFEVPEVWQPRTCPWCSSCRVRVEATRHAGSTKERSKGGEER